MSGTTYMGWTNYATWRVNLEIFDGGEFDGMSADILQEWAEGVIFEGADDSTRLMAEYASAFLDDVNWHEIAEHYAAEEGEEDE